ncbi:related to 3-oxoacyl-[acyl-carrier-protein] reductase 1 [Armillaria ostoyae]|uniref:Related to 3-oxoacyl-[acyl-carrier-protein] reductase 1 n=1 Tax=Armillaria ostoyae TaxID=47428 RepID=A0A284RF43_ARMOS|nr:related to 3-oxoacyl-[acyl-carrier-protein] reductase 1 [Armillaria ostoyae]
MSESSHHLKNLFKLSGLVAVVTGGGTGIGLMIARGLAENGAKVYITGRRKDVLEGVVNSGIIKGEVVALPMDVTVKASILEAKKVIERKEGKLHILVNNAGQAGPMSLWFNDLTSAQHKDTETLGQALFTESEEGWADVFAINVYSIYFVTMAFLGLLDKGTKDQAGYTSSVINITSISAVTKLAQQHFAYNTSKSAASHLTKMLATEFALKGIPVRVNAIAPGVYESEMTKTVIRPEDVDATGSGVLPVPARRAGTGEEMAGTAVYLASPSGCYATGQEIVIDGGYLAVNP